MPRKKKELSLQEMLSKLKNAGVNKPQHSDTSSVETDEVEPLDQRIRRIVGIVESPKRNKANMLFFVMYDIESNKVRRQVSKYLERKGCTRVQHSVFLADIDAHKYQEIREALTDVQSYYDNHDSILICPVSTDLIKNMKIIGKNINISLITRSLNALFF